MKEQLGKISDRALQDFTAKIAQIQKLSPEILGTIVDKLPEVQGADLKSLRDSLTEGFPQLGDTADQDLFRLTSELLLARANTGNSDGNDIQTLCREKKLSAEQEQALCTDGKSEQERLKEEIEKILASKDGDAKKEQDDAKKALEDLQKGLNDQLNGLLDANKLAKNEDPNLGDIPPVDPGAGAGDAGAPPSDSGSGSGGSPSGGSPSGDTGSSTSPKNDLASNANKNSKDNQPLSFPSNKNESSPRAAAQKEEEKFSLESTKKKDETPPPTVKTGAGEPSVPPGGLGDGDLLNPSLPQAPPVSQLAGNSSTPSSVTPPQSPPQNFSGGGGAGIPIAGASGSPLSGGEGDPFSGLGSGSGSPSYDERGRFSYLRTSDKDWVASGGSVEEGAVGAGDGGESGGTYGAAARPPTLAGLGIASPSSGGGGSEGGSARGVFGQSPIRKICSSSAGATVGICAGRFASSAAKAASLYGRAKQRGLAQAPR